MSFPYQQYIWRFPMSFELPPLPYPKNALAPHMSEETLEYHYGKHHQAYVTNLNKLVEGTEFDAQDLETVVRTSTGGIFNNAAQVWNHAFFWNCMKPQGGGRPAGDLAKAIDAAWDGYEAFVDAFSASAVGNFGSGWTWLVKHQDGALEIVNTDNAATPLTSDSVPLLTIDVWEHAYYIDHRNARPRFVQVFFEHLVNWEFAALRLAGEGELAFPRTGG